MFVVVFVVVGVVDVLLFCYCGSLWLFGVVVVCCLRLFQFVVLSCCQCVVVCLLN